MDTFLDFINLPEMRDNQNEHSIQELTDEEVKTAISNLRPNKPARPDSFLSEWYREMKDLLTRVMKRIFNHILKTGETPPSWREAVISLISKET